MPSTSAAELHALFAATNPDSRMANAASVAEQVAEAAARDARCVLVPVQTIQALGRRACGSSRERCSSREVGGQSAAP